MTAKSDLVDSTEDISASSLYNRDLAPAGAERRTWNLWHIAALWIGMAVCIPTYMLASGLISQGMNWWQAILTILLGNAIVLVPMALNAHAGTKYGIPFPVLLRSSFGVFGANIPAMMRALVACGWFGIQTWLGGWAIYQLLRALGVSFAGLPNLLPAFVGLETGPLLCFMLFWAINLWVIWRGIETIKVVETISAPFLIVVGLALLAWAYVKAGGFGAILSQPAKAPFAQVFFPGLTAMVGFWATLSLNIPDFTRFARSQRDQVLGQALGLPTTMTLYSFIGVAVTSATVLIFGKEIWDPIDLLGRLGSAPVKVLSMIALVIATLSTNIAANVVGPANDISNLKPSKISFKMGGYITGVVGILMMPWKLVADPSGYIFTWLIGYSALLGPIAGIMIADYYVVRRTRLDAAALYRKNGIYRYSGGFNLVAIAVLGLAILPNLPGFLARIRVLSPPKIFLDIYPYSWFVGFGIAFLLYSGYGSWRRTRTS